jgi:transcriptional regulator with XRE-family HTH domain
MKRKPRRSVDLRLKIAIVQSQRTQRRVAVETRIGETRLSEIVGRRGTPPSADERERIARYLGLPETDLFVLAPQDDLQATADDAEGTM